MRKIESVFIILLGLLLLFTAQQAKATNLFGWYVLLGIQATFFVISIFAYILKGNN